MRAVQLDAAQIRALAELLRMEDARVLDSALVSTHMQAAEPEVRGRALLAAGRIRDARALPLLLRGLEDEDDGVRARAAFGIGQLGDSSAAAIDALGVAALGGARRPAVEAVAALGRLAAPRGRPVLDSILAGAPRRSELIHAALLAAWRLPHDARTVAHIARWTTAADPETRWRAAYALARGGGAQAVPMLLPLATDSDYRVRSYAVRGLRAPAADTANERERALAALLAAVRDPHAHVRINALALLPAWRAPDRTTPFLVEALDDADPNVAVAAAQALGQVAAVDATGALRLATLTGRTDALRTAALHAWVRADSSTAGLAALEWADSSRWLLRMHSARALARVASPAAVEALRELARDAHHLVATEALTAVRAAAAAEAGSRRLFMEQLGAAHPLVRAAAVRGLAEHAGPADVDLLLQAYDRARQDTVRDAAAAAVLALAGAKRAGVPVESSFFLRFGAQGPPADGLLHQLIVDSIGAPPASWGEPAARINVRTPEYYAEIIRTHVAPILAGAAAPRAVIGTTHGDIVLELAAADAPLTVHNFLTLIDAGYYSGTRWHRVVPNFVIQDGDPRGDGSGGPGYAIRDEINALRYDRGTLGMALSGPDTGGSQFFITHSPQPHLDGGYTVFGRVVEGMAAVDRIVQEDPITSFRAAQ